MIMNSCVSTVLVALCAAVQENFIMGTGRRLPFTPPTKAVQPYPKQRLRRAAMDTAKMAFAPRLDLLVRKPS